MRWPPTVLALLVAALAALMTALAGPSAAAAQPADPPASEQTVVEGIAPNGADAALRDPPAPLIAPEPASDVPPDRATPGRVYPACVRAERAPGRAGDPVRVSRFGRAPPVPAAP